MAPSRNSIIILGLVAAFILGILSANPVVDAVGGWKAAFDLLQEQINNSPITWNSRIPQSTSVVTVDSSAAHVGQGTSITIGTDGLPVISYADRTNDDLKAVKCGNASCSSGNAITTVDSTGFVGGYSSIAIGTDGFPVMTYADETNFNLKVAKCLNPYCISNWIRR